MTKIDITVAPSALSKVAWVREGGGEEGGKSSGGSWSCWVSSLKQTFCEDGYNGNIPQRVLYACHVIIISP